MHRLLIVSPHFPPVNAPDEQRVRMALPYLREFGWEAVVLTVKPEFVEGATLDGLLDHTVPDEVPVVRTAAIPANITRRLGAGNLAVRALPYLNKTGSRLLRHEHFDLVFFSTTQFAAMILGPIWKKKFRVPYMVDFQDPWLDDYYKRTSTPPPGGKLKYGFSRLVARQLEPRVMKQVSHVISVSPAYVQTLQKRYPYLEAEDFTVLSFGIPERDFELLDSLSVEQTIFDKRDRFQHWVYVGRGGKDMAAALRLLFSSMAGLRKEQAEWNNMRFHFVGTSYAPAGRAEETVKPIAKEFGVEDLVEEQTARVPYFESLKLLKEADALLVFGSDSPGYNPSKTATVAFAGKPVLAILHQGSPAAELLRRCNAAEIVEFDVSRAVSESETKTARALQRVFGMVEQRPSPGLSEQELAKQTAREMTRTLCAAFDKALKNTIT